MEKNIIHINGIAVAIIKSNELIITDSQSALDLMSTIAYYDECDRIAVYKEAITDDFFTLSTGIAGEILQKFVNYSKKFAIIGDFSNYSSKALKDFIYECNNGQQIFFVADEQEAIEKLSTAV